MDRPPCSCRAESNGITSSFSFTHAEPPTARPDDAGGAVVRDTCRVLAADKGHEFMGSNAVTKSILGVVLAAAAGCQSGPRLSWWPGAKKNTDSAAIADAGTKQHPALPSTTAQAASSPTSPSTNPWLPNSTPESTVAQGTVNDPSGAASPYPVTPYPAYPATPFAAKQASALSSSPATQPPAAPQGSPPVGQPNYAPQTGPYNPHRYGGSATAMQPPHQQPPSQYQAPQNASSGLYTADVRSSAASGGASSPTGSEFSHGMVGDRYSPSAGPASSSPISAAHAGSSTPSNSGVAGSGNAGLDSTAASGTSTPSTTPRYGSAVGATTAPHRDPSPQGGAAQPTDSPTGGSPEAPAGQSKPMGPSSSPTQPAAAPRPYRPGGTSDYIGRSHAASSSGAGGHMSPSPSGAAPHDPAATAGSEGQTGSMPVRYGPVGGTIGTTSPPPYSTQ